MSVEILLNSAGRLASLAKNSGAQQGNIAAQGADEGQENSDPAARFGALVEKPQSKVSLKGDEPEERQSDDGDKTESALLQHSSAYVLSQSFLALTASQSGMADGNNHSAAGEGKLANTDEIFAEVQPSTSDPRLAKNEKPQPKMRITATTDAEVAAKPQQISTDGMSAASRSKPVDGVADDIVNLLKSDAPTSAQPANGSESSRVVAQLHQQGTRNVSPASSGAVSAQPSAPARIADVQVMSERTFGTVKTLQIRLDPVELGSVTARIRLVGDGVEVHLVAEKAHAAEALAADRSIIEKALKVAGIGDENRISVTVTERGAASSAQPTSASQNAGHQQASGQQQGQQTFNMQNNSDGRNNPQGQPQMQFTSGEGRQNGESGHAGRNNTGGGSSGEVGEREAAAGVAGRNRGLVV